MQLGSQGLQQGVVMRRTQRLGRLAQSLARNRGPMRAASADLGEAFDHSDPPPALAAIMAAPSPAGPVPMTSTS